MQSWDRNSRTNNILSEGQNSEQHNGEDKHYNIVIMSVIGRAGDAIIATTV